jgi:4-deoxy-L-threo-5-hexosulose-uronate ketol-isomerase
METREYVNSEYYQHMDTEGLRSHFLIEDLFKAGEVKLVYSHVDRMIAGSAVPTVQPLRLEAGKQLGTSYFLERREMGIINIGGKGRIIADSVAYDVGPRDAMYLGMGTKDVQFTSLDPSNPAKYYINSAPAHRTCPTRVVTIDQARHVKLGSLEDSNKRTINQFIHPAVLETCQLVMGMTCLEPGSVWNTMPCHTHERRMEVYLYFDMPENRVVFHLMGKGDQIKTIVVRNQQAVISPSWSIHSGAGTGAYTFIWGMAGENQTFDDMDAIAMQDLR